MAPLLKIEQFSMFYETTDNDNYSENIFDSLIIQCYRLTTFDISIQSVLVFDLLIAKFTMYPVWSCACCIEHGVTIISNLHSLRGSKIYIK